MTATGVLSGWAEQVAMVLVVVTPPVLVVCLNATVAPLSSWLEPEVTVAVRDDGSPGLGGCGVGGQVGHLL